MEFNIKKYLVENKLTTQSNLNEDDNTDLTLDVDGNEEDNEDEFGDDEEDDWNKPEEDSEDFEQEPTTTDVQSDEPDLAKKQAELKTLEDKKDALLMQLKSNIISLDQYRDAIGNIPQDIKRLRADIEKAMNVSVDDEEEPEM